MSLSDRFAKMKPQPQAAGRANRQLLQTNSVKDNRNKQVQGKRGVQQSAPTSAGNGRGKGKGKGKPVAAVAVKGAKGKGKRDVPEPANQPDLDKDMDSYWFKAGKGPDPKAVALDRDMDAYFSTKTAAPETVAAVAAPDAVAVVAMAN